MPLRDKEKDKARRQTPEYKARARQASAAWRLANPEKHRANLKEWCKKNKDKADASKREWSKNNKDKVAASAKRQRETRPDVLNKRAKEWGLKNPAARKQIRRRNMLKTKFDLTIEKYGEMLAAQGDSCAICRSVITCKDKTGKRVRALDVDHDHKTGKVRGLLCSKCNLFLGLANDGTRLLASAIRYLKKHGT